MLAASQPLFFGLKLAGSAYLVFLGARTILGVLRGRHQAEAGVVGRSGMRLSGSGALRQGLLSNLGNLSATAMWRWIRYELGAVVEVVASRQSGKSGKEWPPAQRPGRDTAVARPQMVSVNSQTTSR